MITNISNGKIILTQAQYDALTPDPFTEYFVTDGKTLYRHDIDLNISFDGGTVDLGAGLLSITILSATATSYESIQEINDDRSAIMGNYKQFDSGVVIMNYTMTNYEGIDYIILELVPMIIELDGTVTTEMRIAFMLIDSFADTCTQVV